MTFRRPEDAGGGSDEDGDGDDEDEDGDDGVGPQQPAELDAGVGVVEETKIIIHDDD